MLSVGVAMLLGAEACQPAVDLPARPSSFEEGRERMVREQIESRGITNAPVLAAMRKVPRHEFVPANWVERAYDDSPLPIGYEQTISQPYIVALMTDLAQLSPQSKVLEVGTGSGYQAAILAEIVREVYSIEIIEPLAASAAERLARLGYKNVQVKHGDGYLGWPEHAPFDAIIVTAGAEHVPPPLIEQLKPGGRLVIPVGEPPHQQSLWLIEKSADGTILQNQIAPVAFVPLTRTPTE
jgi:protein-L-isoaspartate(D-aspartate) O-methyltransferase